MENELKVIFNSTKTKAEILLYGAIGASMWDDSYISAKDFSDKLKELPSSVKEIDLRVNSPGGSVFEGMTIYQRLKDHSAKVNVFVDGIAASIASIIAMAGDTITIGEGGFFMIHKPWTCACSNAFGLERQIEILDKIESQMVSIYARRTGMTVTEVQTMLLEDKDHWFTSEESVEKGFADETSDPSSQLKVAAMFLPKADWLKTKPTIDVSNKEIKNDLKNYKNSIDVFLARK